MRRKEVNTSYNVHTFIESVTCFGIIFLLITFYSQTNLRWCKGEGYSDPQMRCLPTLQLADCTGMSEIINDALSGNSSKTYL